MELLCICASGEDKICVVNIGEFKVVEEIQMGHRDSRTGPKGICSWNDKIIVSNSFSDDISLIDRKDHKNVQSCYIGRCCSDVKVYGKYAYVICKDCNNIVKFDLNNMEFDCVIPCGNNPNCVDINTKYEQVMVCNIDDDSIAVIDLEKNILLKKIKSIGNPSKICSTYDGSCILVCESNVNYDGKGSLSIISLKNYEVIERIAVGKMPLGIHCDENYCYISNFADGTISVVDINKYKEIKRINVGGMPREIIKLNGYIYVCDYYNNSLIKIDWLNDKKIAIPIGKDPTGMLYLID